MNVYLADAVARRSYKIIIGAIRFLKQSIHRSTQTPVSRSGRVVISNNASCTKEESRLSKRSFAATFCFDASCATAGKGLSLAAPKGYKVISRLQHRISNYKLPPPIHNLHQSVASQTPTRWRHPRIAGWLTGVCEVAPLQSELVPRRQGVVVRYAFSSGNDAGIRPFDSVNYGPIGECWDTPIHMDRFGELHSVPYRVR